MAAQQREVRLALVLNGGVSLAVWIGGVTREIDAARRAFEGPVEDEDTAPLYAEILEALGQEVVVDVIGGASAGGINGVMLGAAIYNQKPLANLRETWIGLGDFRTLLRPAAAPNPPSLMKGDDVVLAKLRELVSEAYGEASNPWDRRLYVYVTATDLFGFPLDFADSTGRAFRERDHRRVFTFEHDPKRKKTAREEAETKQHEGVMRRTVWLGDADAPELLARAARSSSSFPVAFEAHQLDVVDNDDQGHKHWLVDGGILDNQPFNPVLDRIAVLPADGPVKRVVMYVVPYVTEIDWKSEITPPDATARDTYSAAGKLPRDLPKLLGLERVTRESAAQDWAENTRARVNTYVDPKTMEALAKTLFKSYLGTRRVTAGETFHVWMSKNFKPGSGMIGQDAADDPSTVKAVTPPPAALPPLEQDEPWLPGHPDWPKRQKTWEWGLSPAERVASWALLFLGDAALKRQDNTSLDEPRRLASELVWQAREAKRQLVEAFENELAKTPEGQRDAFELARHAYKELEGTLEDIQRAFRGLDSKIAAANKGLARGSEPYALRVQDLLSFEVVQNAFSIDALKIPSPFQFIFASAGIRNSLGHVADTPAKKLSGLKLNHFAGFLKRSWRANDWLWGRLDGVEHLLRAILDLDRIAELNEETVVDKLATTAFGDGRERLALERAWDRTLENYGIDRPDGDRRAAFKALLKEAVEKRAGDDVADRDRSEACFKACRRALAARIQLRIVGKELARVAETARDDLKSGASQVASSVFWFERVLDPGELDPAEQIELFRDMRIGEEKLEDETSSRLVFDVGSQGVAVATAMFAGDRGGLPAAARAMLGTARGLTLASSRLIQLLARIPAAGATAFAILVGLVVWAATSKGTLVGALLPSLALLAIVLGVAILTLATSVFERSLSVAPRLLAFGIFLGVPLGFALTFRWPKWSFTAADWLDGHTGKTAVTVAAALGLAAAGLATFRLAWGGVMLVVDRIRKRQQKPVTSRSWRRLVMSLYRWPVVAALIALAAGFIVERTLHRIGSQGWVSVAAERRGTILVLSLLGTLLLAALFEELLVPAFSPSRGGTSLRKRAGRRLTTIRETAGRFPWRSSSRTPS